MNDVFADLGACVTVAVGFDRHSLPLTEAAVALCKRTGKTLCLVHVVEPWFDHSGSTPFGDDDPLWNVTQAVETSSRDKAKRNLDELATIVPADVRVLMRVDSGKPAERIAVIANEVGTCLLMVGVDTSNIRFVSRGFSTAMSLMVSSPVPVLVVDTAVVSGAAIFGASTRLVLADDLGPSSEAAVEFAFAFAAALGRTDIHHVHVNGLTFSALNAGLDTARAAARSHGDPGVDATRVFDALISDLEKRLEHRCDTSRDYLEAAGGTCRSEVLTGTVTEELGGEIESFDPHLLVLGRHHAYYTKPFFIGRLPYRAMLAYKRPLIIVPNGAEVE